MKRSQLFIVVFVVGLILSGCAATGAKFTEAISPPADQALIYFYRPKRYVASAVIPLVIENKNPVFRLQNGQFIAHTVSPGTYEYHTDTINIDRIFRIEVESGEIYYVRLDIQQGVWTGSWVFSRIFPEQALPELRACCKAGEKHEI